MLDGAILRIDPTHPVARRNRYVAGCSAATRIAARSCARRGSADVREAAPLDLGRAVRRGSRAREHGRAAPGHRGEPDAREPVRVPQLLAAARRSGAARGELSLGGSRDRRRAAVRCRPPRLRPPASPGRPPGQAFAEAQYRCREILDRAASGTLSSADWQAPHHAALLVAFAHSSRPDRRGDRARRGRDGAPSRRRPDPGSVRLGAEADRALEERRGLLARAYAWRATTAAIRAA